MKAKLRKVEFEKKLQPPTASILRFEGVDGFDVYNCSQPFYHHDKLYMFGRVERRSEWMRSWARLFEKVGVDTWRLVPDSMVYQLEDPYISLIDSKLVLGGTHVQVKQEDQLSAYYGYFYYGEDLADLKYFCTGPKNMKDIRLVQLLDRRIGVFSRPRDKKLIEQYGSEALIGFTIINELSELTAETIENATIIPGLFHNLEWGGVNQAYLLDTGKIGVIGHLSFNEEDQSVYTVVSFVFDPDTLAVSNYQMIATRKSFPAGPEKRGHLKDCCFPSGILPLNDDHCQLYSGIGDTQEGVVTIPYPFKGYGKLLDQPILS